MDNCYIDSSGCIVCPAIPPAQFSPPLVAYSNVLGWNASADSTVAIDGNLHVVYSIEMLPVGALCGFRSAYSTGPADPTQLTHAIMMHTAVGFPMYDVYESGVRIQLDYQGAIGDVLEIRRSNEFVRYLVTPSGAPQQLLYESKKRSTGPLIVSACLYANGDQIG